MSNPKSGAKNGVLRLIHKLKREKQSGYVYQNINFDICGLNTAFVKFAQK